jgi:hypothetical protein
MPYSVDEDNVDLTNFEEEVQPQRVEPKGLMKYDWA